VAVVVEPPHQTGVETEGNVQGGQAGLDLLKPHPALGRESIDQGGGLHEQGLGVRMLGIEDAQGIARQTILRIRIQLVAAGLQKGHQPLAVHRPIVGRAEAVELQG